MSVKKKRMIRRMSLLTAAGILFVAGCVWLAGCGNGLVSGDVTLEINGQEIVLEKNKEKVEVDRLDVDHLEIVNASKGDVEIDGNRVAPGESIRIQPECLTEEEGIQVRGRKVDAQIPLLPKGCPNYEVTGKSKTPGEYCVTANGNKGAYMLRMDEEGKIKAYIKEPYPVADFKKSVVDGETRYSYFATEEGSQDKYFLVLLDEKLQEIDRLDYEKDGKKLALDTHQSLWLEDGSILMSATRRAKVTDMPKEIKEDGHMDVEEALVREMKDGKVLWEFRSTDYPQLYTMYNPVGVERPPTSEYYSNYMHFNSFAVDPSDGNLLVSFRNISAVVKLSRKDGSLMWILGGKGDEFGLTEEQKFLCQHSVTTDGKTIMLYDNQSTVGDARLATFELDEENRSVSQYQAYDLDVTTSSYGSAQKVKGDTVLLDYGQGGREKKMAIEEKDLATGTVDFGIDFPRTDADYAYKDVTP